MEDLHRRLFSVLMDHESKHGMAGWRPRGLGRWITLPDNDFRLGKRVALARRSPPLSSATLISTRLLMCRPAPHSAATSER
jgi:hypothetical protein